MKKRRGVFSIIVFFVLLLLFCCVKNYAQADDEPLLEVKIEGLDSNGDCTIIKYGDVEILIDSAERKDAGDKIVHDMDDVMENDEGGVWDYVIFTHPDADHIGNANRVIDHIYSNNWRIKSLIDYGEAISDKTNTSNLYSEKRDSILKSNNDTEYFDASSLDETTKIKEYELSPRCSLKILYNGCPVNAAHNDQSVCCLFEIGDQKLLFTGDLEASGEQYLIDHHKNLIDGVTFFKAGHHGSSSSNSEKFIDVIRPEYVAMTWERKAKGQNLSLSYYLRYTDYIFPTYVKYYKTDYDDNNNNGNDNDDNEYVLYKMFGDLMFSFDGRNVYIITESNNDLEGEEKNIRNAVIDFDGYPINWFFEQMGNPEDFKDEGKLSDEVTVYTFDEELPEYNNCTLVKYGHYDILIDCGSTDTKSVAFVEKLKKYVVDGKIEYVIVSHHHVANISQLIGNYKNRTALRDGVFDQFKIGKIIDGAMTNLEETSEEGFYKRYVSKASEVGDRKTLGPREVFYESLIEHPETDDTILSIKVIGSQGSLSEDENDYSLATIVSFRSEKLLFVGDMVDYSELLDNHKSEISDILFLRVSNSASSISDNESYLQFAKEANPQYWVIGSPLNYTMTNGKVFFSNETVTEVISLYKSVLNDLGKTNIYFCGYILNRNEYHPVNGDLIFRVGYRDKDKYQEMHRTYHESESNQESEPNRKKESESDPVSLDDEF